jgi:hypothetical protein
VSKRVRVTPEGSATELKVLWREDWSQGKQLAAQHSTRTERLQAWVTFIRAHRIILKRVSKGFFRLPHRGTNVLYKTILNIIRSQNNWLKHTILQRRSTVALTALCKVAPCYTHRTASFHPPLGTLTSIQNLGGSRFSPPSIDLHSNYVTSGARPPAYQSFCSRNWHVVHPNKGSDS